MAAWDDTLTWSERDDRLEALGEARTYYGHPEPCDDEFWQGVLAQDAVEGAGAALLAAVDSVIEILPRPERGPRAGGSVGVSDPVGPSRTAVTGERPSLSATPPDAA